MYQHREGEDYRGCFLMIGGSLLLQKGEISAIDWFKNRVNPFRVEGVPDAFELVAQIRMKDGTVHQVSGQEAQGLRCYFCAADEGAEGGGADFVQGAFPMEQMCLDGGAASCMNLLGPVYSMEPVDPEQQATDVTPQ